MEKEKKVDAIIMRSPTRVPVVSYEDEEFMDICKILYSKNYRICLAETLEGYYILNLFPEKIHLMSDTPQDIFSALSVARKMLNEMAADSVHLGKAAWTRPWPYWNSTRVNNTFPKKYSYAEVTRLLHMAINDIPTDYHYGDDSVWLLDEFKKILRYNGLKID